MEIPDLILKLEPLESRNGYSFKNKTILLKSMLHSSFVHENKGFGLRSNERLEFLGDAVLELVISEYLLKKLVDKDEGVLSLKRSFLVREEMLAKIARRMKIQNYIFMGYGEKKEGGNERDSVLSDALEAFWGAVFLDGGFEAAKRLILKAFESFLSEIDQLENHFNFKNQLQEYLQVNFHVIPQYKVVSQTGPEHQKKYKVNVFVQNHYITWGTGSSIKKAEQTASKNALNLIKKKKMVFKAWEKKVLN